LRIVTIVGARPQFIKATAVSREIGERPDIEEIIVHTGQHFDQNMSDVFFNQLNIPRPKYNLNISSCGHGEMTGRMLEKVEKVLLEERPDWVLVYGDTNSTLAGSLASVKLHIPVAHVEAGLRSFNMKMPEEVNRVLTDRISSLLFCPTDTAVENLKQEGITSGVHNFGDVMYDVALYYQNLAQNKSDVLSRFALAPQKFALVTCHRAENTDNPERLREICDGLANVAKQMPVIFPLHPRTEKIIKLSSCGTILKDLKIVPPQPFLDMVVLEKSARVILTDSGGIQKEAFFYRVPCVTMRDETEWVETVDSGWNQLVGASCRKICEAVEIAIKSELNITLSPYGDGKAAAKIVSCLSTCLAD